MVFNSAIFLFCFLPVTLLVYYIPRNPFRNGCMLFASLFFYFWGAPVFLPLLFASILVNYAGGRILGRLNRAGDEKKRRISFLCFMLLNIGALGYWKYTNFLLATLKESFGLTFTYNEILLPIGISFFTFKSISYLADVYKKKTEAERSLVSLALYISFFPQLLAGPIMRYPDFRIQLIDRTLSAERIASGIRRFVIGLAKKVILADSLAVVANSIFSQQASQNTVACAWIGIISYTLQIYFDFSGYSDMAIGLGMLFGFSCPENFTYPYLSKSITEFWRRWHISLSSWFRDYVYIPLGGSRTGNVYFNLFVVFLLTGIWHGASWTFLVWGIYHGCFVIAERFMKTHVKKRPPAVLQWMMTLFIVSIGWVFFRAGSLEYALDFLRSLFGLLPLEKVGFTAQWYLNRYQIFLFVVSVVAMFPFGKTLWEKISVRLPKSALLISNITTIALLGLDIMYVLSANTHSFIYFKF